MKEPNTLTLIVILLEKNYYKKMIKTHHVSTKDQLANLLTKELWEVSYQHLASKLGVRDLFQPPTWGGVLCSKGTKAVVVVH